jgi:hypothetical protein
MMARIKLEAAGMGSFSVDMANLEVAKVWLFYTVHHATQNA